MGCSWGAKYSRAKQVVCTGVEEGRGVGAPGPEHRVRLVGAIDPSCSLLEDEELVVTRVSFDDLPHVDLGQWEGGLQGALVAGEAIVDDRLEPLLDVTDRPPSGLRRGAGRRHRDQRGDQQHADESTRAGVQHPCHLLTWAGD